MIELFAAVHRMVLFCSRAAFLMIGADAKFYGHHDICVGLSLDL